MLLMEHDLPFWGREKPGATVTLVTGVEMLKGQTVQRWFAAASERCRSCMSGKGATLLLNAPIM